MKNLLILSILIFSIDPVSNQVVLTTGPDYIEVVKVKSVMYNGRESNLNELLKEQVKGRVLTTKISSNNLEVTDK